MNVDLDKARVGDQFHILDGIVEIAKPIVQTIDGSFEIWTFHGDMFGVVDYETEVQVKQSDLLESVTQESLDKYLKATPQYQAGLKDGWEEVLDYLRSKGFAWYEGAEREALLNIAVSFEHDLKKRYGS
jgi:hypothetical protein